MELHVSRIVIPIIQLESTLRVIGGLNEKVSIDLVSLNSSVSSGIV